MLVRRWTAAAVAAVLVSTVTVAGTPAAAQAAKPALPHATPVASVPGVEAVPGTATTDPSAGATMLAGNARPVDWPAAGAADLDIGAAAAARGGISVAAKDRRVTHARLEVLDRAKTAPAGRPLVMRVSGVDASGAVDVRVDYRGFAEAFGGDWAARLHLVALPACALTQPDNPACQQRDLPAGNDRVTGTVSATVDATADGTLVALASGTSTDGGTYAATPLQATSNWQAGDQSGDFTWSYPMRVPPGLGGPEPDVGLSYSAQSQDGKTAATNSQPSWAGDGFDYQPPAIERSYSACIDDGQAGVGDLCWGTDNALLTLPGHSGELIQVSTSPDVWKIANDDGTRVERLTNTVNGDNNNEYWKVTTVDGTQYFFGLNRLPGWTTETRSAFTVPVYGNNSGEPCYSSSGFSASWCIQAYKWNLDYVVDSHGNTMSYWYTQETNHYARNVTDTAVSAYARGGWVDHIDYGTRQDAGKDSVFTTPAPARVVFGTADRCLTAGSTCTSTNPSNWPDVPWDQQCDSTTNCAGKYSPAFYTQKRLSSVTTQVRQGSAYANVERWSLTQVFKDPGDGHAKTLWLSSIAHTGLDNGKNTPAGSVTFSGVALSNRVDTSTTKDPIVRFRISSITNEAGGVTSVNYLPAECVLGSVMPSSADNNTKRCYPVYWTPYGATAPTFDWFHKYVVGSVTMTDPVGAAPAETFSYQYTTTGPMWHYDVAELVKPAHKSWGAWRGYSRVRVTHGVAGGSQQQQDTVYFQGMNGDKLSSGTRSASIAADPDFGGGAVADDDWLAGQTREEIVYNGTGNSAPVVSKTLTTPWANGPTATRIRNGVTTRAYLTNVRKTATLTALDGGRGWRRTESTNYFDVDDALPNPIGLITRVEDANDTATAADDTCTRTTFATNTALNIRTTVAEAETVSVSCSTTPNRETDVVVDKRTWYDGATGFDKTVTRGDPTHSETLSSWNGGSPTYLTTSQATFDAYGRTRSTVDALGDRTATDYTPASGGPVTAVTKTDPKGWTTTTTTSPGHGQPLVTTDINGKRHELDYDGMGMLTAEWDPGRDRATQTANMVVTYVVRASGGPTAVSTAKLKPDGSGYNVSWTLYDGMLRVRQTQSPAPGGGRIVSDTKYDSTGQVAVTTSPYFNAGNPSSTLFVPTGNVPGQTLTSYDHAGRVVASVFQLNGVEKWRTTTAYGGDRTDVTPPPGGTASSTWTDAEGRTIQLVQYHGGTPSGTADTTTYTYRPTGQVETSKDAAGNLWQFHYDQLGRQDWTADPDKGRTDFTYDALGQQLTSKDARQNLLTTQYDELGRKTALYQGDATTGTKLAAWTYDTVVKGRIASSVRYDNGNAYSTTINSYDDHYLPTSTTVTIPAVEGALAGSYTTTSTYNADSSVATTTLPAAAGYGDETLTYTYDDLGNPATLSGLDTYLTGAAYDSLNRPGSTTLSDGHGKTLTQVWNYEDGTNRMVEHGTVDEGAGVAYQDAWYTYDATGDVTSVKDLMGQYGGADDNQCFRYDYYRRLAEAWTPTNGDCAGNPSTAGLGGPAQYWQSYRYDDKTGNRTSRVDHASAATTTHTYAYPVAGAPRPHALSSVTTGTAIDKYDYDPSGNTKARNFVGKPGQTLLWDSEGHLASVADSTGTTTYLYDANGTRLIARTPKGNTLYLGDQEITAGSSGLTCVRYYGPYAVRSSGAGLQWFVNDPHGTTDLLLRASDLAKTQRRSTPFGEARGTNPTWPISKGFVGGQTDGTGLTHLGAREYDPQLGRFVSVDPLMAAGDPQSWDAYGYSHASPVTNSDPSGLSDGFRKYLYKDYTTTFTLFGWQFGIRVQVFRYCNSAGYCDGKWTQKGFVWKQSVSVHSVMKPPGWMGPMYVPGDSDYKPWSSCLKHIPMPKPPSEKEAKDYVDYQLLTHKPRAWLDHGTPGCYSCTSSGQTCDAGDFWCEVQLPKYKEADPGDVLAWMSYWIGVAGPLCDPCDALSTVLGYASSVAYLSRGENGKAGRQAAASTVGVALGSVVGGKVTRNLIKDGQPEAVAELKGDVSTWLAAQVAGAPICGWTPTGCDAEEPWMDAFSGDMESKFDGFFSSPLPAK